MEQTYENITKFGIHPIVCLNKFDTDTLSEIEIVRNYCVEKGYAFAINNAYSDGGKGAIDLANQVLQAKESDFHYLYSEDDKIVEKIESVCKNIYGASKVNYQKEVLDKIKMLEKNKKSNIPICVAKTQYSFSDDPKKVGVPQKFEVTVKDIQLYSGAGFITVLLGDIMVMPGLSRHPNYEKIDVVDGEIVNLS